MKKILFLLLSFILLIPSIKAKEGVYIDSISIDDNTTAAVELSEPKFEGLKINFDVSFSNINDFIQYKVIIKNDSSSDYELDNSTVFKESEYIKYEYIFNDNNTIVKKNTSTSIYIKISYTKEVPASQMTNGVFIENNSFNISLSNDVVNPKTGVVNYILLIGIAALVTIMVYYFVLRKQEPIMFILLISLILIPSSFALSKIRIDVETKVTVKKGSNVLESRYIDSDESSIGNNSGEQDGIINPQERDFWTYYDKISSVTFKSNNEAITDYDYKFDVSEAKNNSIIAYLKRNEDTCVLNTGALSTNQNSCIDVYIVANGKIYANKDSSYVFANMHFLKAINGLENYDTTYALTMEGMFLNTGRNDIGILSNANLEKSYIPRKVNKNITSNGVLSLNLSTFNTSSVTNMSSMFDNTSLNMLNLDGFDTSNVENMSYMFFRNESIVKLDLSGFNTSKVIYMNGMFSECRKLTSLNISSFDTSKVEEMSNMFDNCNQLQTLDVSHFNTSNVKNMEKMFYNCQKLQTLDLTHFNTSKVINMASMFYNTFALQSLDLSHFNTSNVTDMSGMFYNSAVTTLDISHFDTSNVTDMSNMFNTIKVSTLDLSHFNTGKVTDMSGMFTYSKNLTSLNISSFDTSKVVNMSYMFAGCNNIKTLNLSGFNTPNVIDMSYMFRGCEKLENLNIENFNTSNVTNMQSLFQDCSSLVSLNLSHFNTSNVINMQGLFRNCSSLVSLNLSHFNTSKVTNMSELFYNCSALTSLNVDSFNTSKVVMFDSMFRDCIKIITLNLSHFNTSNAESMVNMFYNCSSITSLDISQFDTSKVINMTNMFYHCTSISNLDISSFNTSKVINMNSMFRDLTNCNAIYVSSMWSVENVEYSSDMFGKNWKLRNFDSTVTDKTNANTSSSGYLTLKSS